MSVVENTRSEPISMQESVVLVGAVFVILRDVVHNFYDRGAGHYEIAIAPPWGVIRPRLASWRR